VVLFSTTRLPQRERLFHWVGPIYTQTWAFYGRKNSGLQIDSLEQARRVARIGTYLRDAKEQYLNSLGFENLVSANRNISNIRHLIDGDIDLWVSSDFNMPYQARQAGVDPGQLELLLAFRRVENYIAFSLETPLTVVRAWQHCLDEIKQDGTYAALMEKYDFHPEFFSAP
jgi:polar amino acid transport system substrate-binding protein